MKMKYLFNILITFSLYLVTLSMNTVSNLWSKELLGKPYRVKYTSEDEILISTTKGIVSKLSTEYGEVLWRKNMIYNTNLELDGKGQYCLLLNKEDKYADLVNCINSQLIWSMSFDKVDSVVKGLRWSLLNKNNQFLGILFESSNIKIFNSEKILADIESVEDEEFSSYYINEDEENLVVFSIIKRNEIKVKKYELSGQSISVKSKSDLVSRKLYEEDDDDIHNTISIRTTSITKDFGFVLFEDYSYVYFRYNTVANKDVYLVKGSIVIEKEEMNSIIVNKLTNLNVIVLANLSSNSSNYLKVLSMEKNSVEILPIENVTKEEIFIDVVENSKISSFYIFKKNDKNLYSLHKLEIARNNIPYLKDISSHKIHEDFNIQSFTINPYNFKNYLLLTKENRIYFLEKKRSNYLWKNDQAFTNLQYSELITYIKAEENEIVHTYNDFNSIFKNRAYTKIIFNIFNNIITDAKDIFTRIKNNLENLLSFYSGMNTNSEINKERNVHHNLIVFTKDSEELYVLDASTGEIKLNKQFRNKQLYKIIRNPSDSNGHNDKNVYLIFKEKTSESNLSSFKLNLETKEFKEEDDISQQVTFEELLSKQSDNLIKTEALEASSYDLIVKNDVTFSKDILNRFLNKFKIKTSNKGIYGLKVGNNTKLNIAWSVNTKPFAIQYPNVHKNVITTYHSAGKVFYKYIDSNLMLTLTNLSQKTLLVSIIRTTNGKILYQSSISNVDFSQKILSVFEENMILISYMKKEKNVRRSEIFAIEIMKREIEHSLLQMLEKLFKLNLFTESIPIEELNNEVQESDLVFLTHTYVIPRKLKGLFTTKTLLNVENKYFIFLFENNQAFLVDKRGVSPRRPLVKEDKSKPGTHTLDTMNSPYIDPELTPYNPLLVFDHKQILNVDFLINQIDNILISPTEFESTFILCTEGSSFTCYKISPDKTFDALSPSFSYAQIALFLSVVISIAFLLRRYVKKNEFKIAFLSSN